MRKLIVAVILAGLLALATAVPVFAVAHPFVPIDCPNLDGLDPTTTPRAAQNACDHLFGDSTGVD